LSDRERTSHNLNVDILELNSLFDLAYHSGFVSQMNYDILNFEISKLTATIAEYNSESISSNKGLFDNEYFYVRKMEQDDSFYKGQNPNQNQNNGLNKNVFYNDVKDKFENSYSGPSSSHSDSKSDAYKSKGQNYKGQHSPNSPKGQNKKTNVDKIARREKIVTEAKRQKSVSVKDIAKVVTDCSEKTLQRELLGMVDEGILNKEGERRWSKYSMK
jgi:hypothetical protein